VSQFDNRAHRRESLRSKPQLTSPDQLERTKLRGIIKAGNTTFVARIFIKLDARTRGE